ILAGSGILSAAGSEDQSWQECGRLYALTPFGRRTSYHVTAGATWRSTALKVDARIIDRVANDHVPDIVREAVDNGGTPISTSMPLAPALARVAEDLVRPIYRGRMATLYRESKVLELLALQFDAFAAEPGRHAGLTPREAVRVRDARDRLLSDLKDTPQLHALAQSVGMTPKRLNQGFRELYGTTVFEMLRDTRLDAARELLAELPDTPLKQIAWTVGYAQATNFISAYRRRFGVPPGQHKRLARGD
ncbi:MAG: AraC family transcriptional regulator, partial [Hyphomicrobiales bacterium]